VEKALSYFKGDRVIWVITILMLAFSLVSVYSFIPVLVKVEGGTPIKYLFKHFIYILISLAVAFWVHRKNPKYVSQLSKFGFYLAIGLLIWAFFTEDVNNAKRWIRIPFVGLTFQASDFARLAMVIYVSRLLVKKKNELGDWRSGFLPVVLPIVIICALIVKDNFSTAAILFAIGLALLFLGKVPFGKIAALIGGGVSLLVLIVLIHLAAPSLNLLPRFDTWQNRIFNRVNDDVNVIENAQVLNAQDAIYNGRIDWSIGDDFSLIGGQGVGDGKLKEYLPEAYADFYYSSFVEEFGPISAVILVMLYLILLYRIMRIGLRAKDIFYTYVCVGISMLMLSQACVNMLVCTGIFPVTGQNMPLLAMGGSAMMMTCLALGIVQAIAIKQTKEEADDKTEVFETE